MLTILGCDGKILNVPSNKYGAQDRITNRLAGMGKCPLNLENFIV